MKKQEQENERGHEARVLHFSINGKRFDWSRQYITGAEIREVGRIPESDDVFLSVEKPWKDELIENDTKVNLARPKEENFYSEPKDKNVIIIVSGMEKEWKKKRISFEEVIVLAYGQYIDKPTMVYTVAYEDGPRQNPEGSMVKGQVVFVKDKMIFHATATDKS